jgi:hypothetical protein
MTIVTIMIVIIIYMKMTIMTIMMIMITQQPLMLATRHTYEGGSSFAAPAPYDATMHAAAHALIRLAVIIMADFAA